jgi:hypothetical protein
MYKMSNSDNKSNNESDNESDEHNGELIYIKTLSKMINIKYMIDHFNEVSNDEEPCFESLMLNNKKIKHIIDKVVPSAMSRKYLKKITKIINIYKKYKKVQFDKIKGTFYKRKNTIFGYLDYACPAYMIVNAPKNMFILIGCAYCHPYIITNDFAMYNSHGVGPSYNMDSPDVIVKDSEKGSFELLETQKNNSELIIYKISAYFSLFCEFIYH